MLKTERYFSIVPALMLEIVPVPAPSRHSQRSRGLPFLTQGGSTGSFRLRAIYPEPTKRIERACSSRADGQVRCDRADGQVRCEIDRRDHAVGSGDSFAGNFKRSPVIGTGASERKTERHIHTLVKGVKF